MTAETPTNQDPVDVPTIPPDPEPAAPKKRKGGGLNPFVVLGAAVVLGVVAAKVLDWRGHGHWRW